MRAAAAEAVADLLGVPDRELDREAEALTLSVCRSWPAEYREVQAQTGGRFGCIVGSVRCRWGRLADATGIIVADLPYRPPGARWDVWCARDDPVRLAALSGWHRDDLLGLWLFRGGPALSPGEIARRALAIEERQRWRALVPPAVAMLDAVADGRRPAPDAWVPLQEAMAAP